MSEQPATPTRKPITCERCGQDGAGPHSLVIKVESVGGIVRTPAGFTLCTDCYYVGADLEPIEDLGAFLGTE